MLDVATTKFQIMILVDLRMALDPAAPGGISVTMIS